MNIFNKSEFEASAVSVEPSFFDPVSRCMVFAPHPDDESLGCGGLIALLRKKGIQVKVILTTDGAKSHPNSKLYPAQQLAELRKVELIEALQCLKVDAGDISFYNGPDSKLPAKGDAGFDGYSNRMAEELLSFLPQLILVPYELDPHCDHRATWQMLQQALTNMGNFSGMVWEYPIWLYENASLEDLPNLQHGELKSLDINDFMTQKKAAIYAHKSQTTRLISDDPKGFLLTEAMISNFTSGTEYYLQRELLNAGFTLSEDYFEKMYAQHPDPWNFEQSEYEKLKYEATLQAIPARGDALKFIPFIPIYSIYYIYSHLLHLFPFIPFIPKNFFFVSPKCLLCSHSKLRNISSKEDSHKLRGLRTLVRRKNFFGNKWE